MMDWKMYGQIQEHKKQGFKKSQTARMLGKDYKTVSKYWDMPPNEFSAEKESAGNRLRKAESYEDYVVETLRDFPDMSAAQLYDWILEKREGLPLPFKGRAFRAYVSKIRLDYGIIKLKEVRVYNAMDDPPMGYQAQVDMGEIFLETPAGKRKKVYCFAMVMSNSRYKYVYWIDRPFTTALFIEAHQKAFSFFGGRTEEIAYDQDKVLAVSENNGDIIYTESFQEYINIMKFKVYLCRGADPESKGRIEAVVKYAKYGFAKHRIYHDLDTLNKQCLDWLERTGNAKVHETTKKIPAEVFALEKEYLKPVPSFEPCIRSNQSISYPVRKDNVVLYKSNRYRVPSGTYTPGTRVCMAIDKKLVHITDIETGEIYVTHPLSFEKGILVGNLRKDRDISHSQRELFESTLSLLGNTETGKVFLERIHKEKSRYFRDQMGVLKNICTEYPDKELLEKTLAYCMQRNLYSAGDFKSTLLYLNQLSTTPKHVPQWDAMAALPNKYKGMIPAIRNLNDYEKAMKGSGAID